MARRKRAVKCSSNLFGLCAGDVRRGGLKWCAPCYEKLKRPKAFCVVCKRRMAADLIVGAGRCKPCTSDRLHGIRIAETYGLTAEMYAILLRAQGGKCAICWRKPASKRLAVDHDHTSGNVRGLLCRNCNRNVLGHLRESREALARAINYLASPPAIELFGEVRPDVTT